MSKVEAMVAYAVLRARRNTPGMSEIDAEDTSRDMAQAWACVLNAGCGPEDVEPLERDALDNLREWQERSVQFRLAEEEIDAAIAADEIYYWQSLAIAYAELWRWLYAEAWTQVYRSLYAPALAEGITA